MPTLPEGTRLLHVGLTKTGTTALQTVASRRRRDLLRYGVRYPGRRYNHRQAAFALYRRAGRRSDPRPDAWDELQRELGSDPGRRALISNEFIAGWDDAVAARFVDQLGPDVHVVITLRSFGALLPSIWQQYVKGGYPGGFEDFLRIVLLAPTLTRSGSGSRSRFSGVPVPPNLERHDQGEVVARWARVAGPERVTVVVGNKSRPQLIPRAFEDLLGLPAGVLYDPAQGGSSSNRSLSVQEAGLLLAVNQLLVDQGVRDADLVRILRRGATARFLDACPPPDPTSALSLPPWAAEAAAVRGQAFAAAITASRVCVVGDLGELGAVSKSRPGGWNCPSSVPTELAAQALVGALSGGIGGGPDFGRSSGAGSAQPIAAARRWWRGVRRVPARLRGRVRRSGSSLG